MKKTVLCIILLISLGAVKTVRADTFSWSFNTDEYYTISDSSKVEISGGMAKLIPIDQTDDDNSSTGFGGGTHDETQWVTDHLELTDVGKTNGVGVFASRIIDAGIPVSRETISWFQYPHNALFAVDSYEDVYRSIDGGNNWAKVNFDFSGDTTDAVEIIHSSDKTLYIVDRDSRILSSADEGTSWKAVNLDYNGAESNAAEEILFDHNDYMYIVETDDDVWRSIDLGSTWTKVNDDYDLADVTSVRAMVSNATSVFIVSANAKVWESDDSGTTWAEINTNYNMGDTSSPRVATSDNTYIYIAEDDGDIWRSDNWGVSFTKICDDFDQTASPYPSAIAWDEIDQLYLVSDENDLYMSSDFGASWIKISTDFLEICRGLDGVSAGIQLQVRSDDDNSNWPEFTGPDGTASTFYTNPDSLLNVSPNRYFQYRAYLSTNNSSCTPELDSVVIGPARYPSSTPTVVNSLSQRYTSLSSFSEVLGPASIGNVKYQISNDSIHWYYWNGSGWTEQTGYGYPNETNTAEEVNVAIPLFYSDVGDGDFYFKAFFNSDGSQLVELDNIQIGYNPDPSDDDSNDPPIIEGVYPQIVNNTEDSEVVIIGKNFIDTPEIRIGGASISEVNFVSSTELEMIITKGFTPGTYDVLVVNPDDRCSILEDGITIEDPSPPVIQHIFPDSGVNDTTTDVFLIGINFKQGVTLQLGEIEIEDVFLVNENLLAVSIPPGITPGVYDIAINNPDDRSGRLENAFTVLPSCAKLFNLKVFPDTLLGSKWLTLPNIILISIEEQGYSFSANSEISFDPEDDLSMVFNWTLDKIIVVFLLINPNPDESLVNLIVSNILVEDESICEGSETITVTKEDALAINVIP